MLGQGQGKKLTEAARLLARRELYIPGQEDDEQNDQVDEALAAFGLVADRSGAAQPADDEFALWPEALPVFNLFQACSTQWRHGPMGPTGFDYMGIRCSPAFRRLARDQRESVFEDLCIMERAWLDAVAQRNNGS